MDRGRCPRCRAAGQYDLEADARRVRGARDGPGDRRGTARVHDPAQGVDAGLGGLMATVLGRRRGLEADARSALVAALEDPIFELLPLKNLPDQIAHLPAGARVSVTASPAKGIDATVDRAVNLQAEGFRAVPHLSARMIPDRATLASLLDRARDGGLTHAFVVG